MSEKEQNISSAMSALLKMHFTIKVSDIRPEPPIRPEERSTIIPEKPPTIIEAIEDRPEIYRASTQKKVESINADLISASNKFNHDFKKLEKSNDKDTPQEFMRKSKEIAREYLSSVNRCMYDLDAIKDPDPDFQRLKKTTEKQFYHFKTAARMALDLKPTVVPSSTPSTLFGKNRLAEYIRLFDRTLDHSVTQIKSLAEKLTPELIEAHNKFSKMFSENLKKLTKLNKDNKVDTNIDKIKQNIEKGMDEYLQSLEKNSKIPGRPQEDENYFKIMQVALGNTIRSIEKIEAQSPQKSENWFLKKFNEAYNWITGKTKQYEERQKTKPSLMFSSALTSAKQASINSDQKATNEFMDKVQSKDLEQNLIINKNELIKIFNYSPEGFSSITQKMQAVPPEKKDNQIAIFLKRTEGLDPKKVQEFINKPENKAVLKAYEQFTASGIEPRYSSPTKPK